MELLALICSYIRFLYSKGVFYETSNHLVSPVVFLIEEDNDTRPIFRHLLKDQGYQIALAIDEEDALERVSHGEFKVSLIIIDLLRTLPEKMLEFARGLSRKANLDVPIVAITGNFGADLEGKNNRVSENEYIVYLEDGDQLFGLLDDLINQG